MVDMAKYKEDEFMRGYKAGPSAAAGSDMMSPHQGYSTPVYSSPPPVPVTTAATPGAQSGMRFTNPIDQENYGRIGLDAMLRSPSPNVQRALTGDANTGYMVMEAINGGSGPPALMKPNLSPTLWSGTPDQMALANTAINQYNQNLLRGYEGKNATWADQVGGIPEQQSRAGLYAAQAASEPIATQSTVDLNTAKIAEANAKASAAGYKPYTTEYTPEGSAYPVKETVYQDVLNKGGQPKASRSAAAAAVAALPAKRRSIVDKYFNEKYPNGGAPPEEILAYIEQLQK